MGFFNSQESKSSKIKEDELECIYEKDNIFETNKCKTCNSHLFVGDEGFLFCSNNSCGIMYKDVIDFGAEWNIMEQMIIIIAIQHDAVCQLIHY